MSCLYCWNQPKKYGRYDLILDGKISAKDITLTNGEGSDFVSLVEKLEIIDSEMGFMHSYDDTYKSFNELNAAFNQRLLKEHVVYLVPNESTSSSSNDQVTNEEVDRFVETVGRESYLTEDKYDEYMIIKGQLELIGSGSYQRIRQDIEAITGYGILHDWDGDNINQNDDKVNDLNTRLNRDRVIFEEVTGYDYTDAKTEATGVTRDSLHATVQEVDREIIDENSVNARLNRDREIFKSVTGYDYLDAEGDTLFVTKEQIEEKVQEIDKTKITGDAVNARLNRDREIFKAVTGYEYDDEEDGTELTLDEISQHVENTDKTVITGDCINARLNRDREIFKAVTGYEKYEDEIDDETQLKNQINNDVQSEGGTIKEVVSGITGYEYHKNPNEKDKSEGTIKEVVSAITGYNYHVDPKTEDAANGSIKEVVSAITGYDFNTDLSDDDGKNIKGKVNDITGYEYNSPAANQGGNIREVVSAITGYDFNKVLKETNNDDKDENIHTRIVNEIERATERENDIQSKLTTITGYDFSTDLTQEGGNIHTRIVNEVERATKKENDLQGQINQEITDRENGDTTLGNRIDNEIEAREKADKTLQDNIDDEIEARETADEIEANTRSTNDAALQSQITSLLKRIVELELDKGQNITIANITQSEPYVTEDETIGVNATLSGFEVNGSLSSTNNTLGIKLDSITVEDKSFDVSITGSQEVNIDELGNISTAMPVIFSIDSTTEITTDDVTTKYQCIGDLRVIVSGTYKEPKITPIVNVVIMEVEETV